MVDVAPTITVATFADQLTRCITGAAKVRAVPHVSSNLSWQVFTFISWADKERGLVQYRVGCNQRAANTPSPPGGLIVGIGKARGSISC